MGQGQPTKLLHTITLDKLKRPVALDYWPETIIDWLTHLASIATTISFVWK